MIRGEIREIDNIVSAMYISQLVDTVSRVNKLRSYDQGPLTPLMEWLQGCVQKGPALVSRYDRKNEQAIETAQACGKMY